MMLMLMLMTYRIVIPAPPPLLGLRASLHCQSSALISEIPKLFVFIFVSLFVVSAELSSHLNLCHLWFWPDDRLLDDQVSFWELPGKSSFFLGDSETLLLNYSVHWFCQVALSNMKIQRQVDAWNSSWTKFDCRPLAVGHWGQELLKVFSG